MTIKRYTPLDDLLNEVEYAIECIYNKNNIANVPKDNIDKLNKNELKISKKVMRINHMGEVCAQGLYRGQAAHTKNQNIKEKLYAICLEENEHLKLCNLRIRELDGKQSIFNPVWYISSYMLGSIAALKDTDWELGFIEETEKQVKEHLEESINQLPEKDVRSREFLNKIAVDEEKHRKTVINIGSNEIPEHVKKVMNISSKIMKRLTSYI
tara:strand:+ start:975 stop:1607 length:633 start_codon:yes stop_codon:yes gene_type:complete